MQEYETMANDYIREARDDEIKQRNAEREARLKQEFETKHKTNFIKNLESLAKGIEEFSRMTP